LPHCRWEVSVDESTETLEEADITALTRTTTAATFKFPDMRDGTPHVPLAPGASEAAVAPGASEAAVVRGASEAAVVRGASEAAVAPQVPVALRASVAPGSE
jgi:hypothetical protein